MFPGQATDGRRRRRCCLRRRRQLRRPTDAHGLLLLANLAVQSDSRHRLRETTGDTTRRIDARAERLGGRPRASVVMWPRAQLVRSTRESIGRFDFTR